MYVATYADHHGGSHAVWLYIPYSQIELNLAGWWLVLAPPILNLSQTNFYMHLELYWTTAYHPNLIHQLFKKVISVCTAKYSDHLHFWLCGNTWTWTTWVGKIQTSIWFHFACHCILYFCEQTSPVKIIYIPRCIVVFKSLLTDTQKTAAME